MYYQLCRLLCTNIVIINFKKIIITTCCENSDIKFEKLDKIETNHYINKRRKETLKLKFNLNFNVIKK